MMAKSILKNKQRRAAAILLETQAVLIRPDEPFTLTSGRKSPVYVDCRRLIGFVEARRELMQMGCQQLDALQAEFDVIAGGETAGIPYAAFLSEMLDKPMAYIRKQNKGFGRNARIEGMIKPKDRVLLVEDLATDGGSKLSFIEAIREVDAICDHCFVIFHYGVFPQEIAKIHQAGVSLHSLCVWEDVLNEGEEMGYLTGEQCKDVRAFLSSMHKA